MLAPLTSILAVVAAPARLTEDAPLIYNFKLETLVKDPLNVLAPATSNLAVVADKSPLQLLAPLRNNLISLEDTLSINVTEQAPEASILSMILAVT